MTNHENHEVDHYEPLATRLTTINIINIINNLPVIFGAGPVAQLGFRWWSSSQVS
jgi:hypothetical protein